MAISPMLYPLRAIRSMRRISSVWTCLPISHLFASAGNAFGKGKGITAPHSLPPLCRTGSTELATNRSARPREESGRALRGQSLGWCRRSRRLQAGAPTAGHPRPPLLLLLNVAEHKSEGVGPQSDVLCPPGQCRRGRALQRARRCWGRPRGPIAPSRVDHAVLSVGVPEPPSRIDWMPECPQLAEHLPDGNAAGD